MSRFGIILFSIIIQSGILFCQSSFYHEFIDESGKGYTKVPMFIKENSPLVEVSLDTNKVYLLLDIGGFAALNLDMAIVKNFGYTSSLDSIASKNYKGETIVMNDFNIEKFQIGNFSFTDFVAQAGTQKNKSGYIGLSFFKSFKVLFDYKNAYLYLINDSIPAELDIESWNKISFDYTKYGISTNVKVDNKTFSFFWDTGARFSLLKPEYVDTNNILKRGEFDFYKPSSFQLDGAPNEPFDFLVMDFKFPPFDGVIGHNFFAGKMVLIDFEQNLIFIK